MFTLSIMQENLIVLFLLLPFTLWTWWQVTRWVFKSLGKYITTKERIRRIYSDPLAASIHTSAIIITVGLLVIAAYGRIV